MESLIRKYRNLLKTVPLKFERSLTNRINWRARAICIAGARGTGKSTLMLQYLRKNLDPEASLYVSLDDMYFQRNTFTEVAEEFYRNGGRHLFIDEVHRYTNWQQEVKNIYDFYPELQLVVSGSSILALQKSQADRKSTRLNSSHVKISYAVFCLKKKR